MWGHCSFLLGPGVHKFCLFSPSAVSPVSCKFWWLYGGVKGNLLQEGLCHSQVCCTQSSCPCGSPLLTRTSTGDTHTQFCLSLCGVSGSWCTEGFFEPSEHLWRECGFILNANLPFLPSCWASLTLDMGYLLTVAPVPCTTAPAPNVLLGLLLCPWTWVISSQLLQHNAAATPDYLRSFIIFYMYQI